jgi:ectoine hydroxylase-related dioxygenase (phytanoyl-CoA dioxygenase family)
LRRLKRAVLAGESSIAPLLDGLQDYHVRDVDAADCETLGASRGDVVFFHSLLIHGTGANLTTRDRVASIISYMLDGARLPNIDAETLPLARIPE